MFIIFFDIKSVITAEWVHQGQAVNEHYYLFVLTTPGERVRRERTELWQNDSRILRQDNAPARNALSVEQFLAENRTPCDFWLFPKSKGTPHFESVDKQNRPRDNKGVARKRFPTSFRPAENTDGERCTRVQRGGEMLNY